MSENNILTIGNLSLAFYGQRGRVPAVQGVSLEVKPGKILALVGESGCGKTALSRAIMGLHAAHAKIESGTISIGDKIVSQMTDKELEKIRGKEVSMIFQDPMSSLNPVYSIGDQISEAILAHEKISKKEAWKRTVSLLERVGINNAEKRARQYPHHFSGGMRQRVAIAIAIALKPKLIIADEPTTALDLDAQGEILKLLKNLAKEEQAGMLFITHDMGIVEDFADRIAIMKEGKILEQGDIRRIFDNPKEEYTRTLLSFSEYGKGKSHYHGHIHLGHEVHTDSCDGTPALHISGLSKAYQLTKLESRKVLENFHLNVYKGEIVGIIGPSGCGKSTLARCIMGMEKPDAGEIKLASGMTIQMIFQDSSSAFNNHMRIQDIIAEPLVIRKGKGQTKMSKAEIFEKVKEVMGQVQLETELMDRFPYEISGGQRQRAAIARALITDPDFIIADEPISALDIPIQSQIIHLLKQLHDQRKLTMIIIAHDVPMVEHISDRIISM